ncbi:hypothetical protein [uncultured Lactobacillus sp.]|uniref:hypothetical protein n=1 Tax=uncultured Lactobacillus sp. TaxID=153152 RepID=UPI0026367C67|nr:hypothetical protein [uncultured Lactobacillus sp.]
MKIKGVKYQKGEWYYELEDGSLERIVYKHEQDTQAIKKDWEKVNKNFRKAIDE